MSPESGNARENHLRREEKKMDAIIKRGLNLVERIVYCVCILTIVVLGEVIVFASVCRCNAG